MNSISYNLRHCPQRQADIVHSHFHNDIEILMPLTDGNNMAIENKIYPIRRGVLFVMREHTLHNQLTPSKTYDRFILHVDPQVVMELSTPRTNFAKYLGSCSHVINIVDHEETFIRLFEGMQVSEDQFGYDILQIQRFMDLLMEICRQIDIRVPVPQAASSSDIKRIMKIQDYIQEHMTEKITLDSIASEFFISKYHLSHIFKENTNYGIIEYVNYCRISKASYLLRTGTPASHVGEQVGFRSSEHFIRTFKKIVGMTPNQYYTKFASAVSYLRTNGQP